MICDGCGKERHADAAGFYPAGEDDLFWFCFFCRKEAERFVPPLEVLA